MERMRSNHTAISARFTIASFRKLQEGLVSFKSKY